MRLHREGRKILISEFILLILAATIPSFFITIIWLLILIALPFLILFLLSLWFFRIPQRKLPLISNRIVAPADGKIVVIEKTKEDEYLHEERIQISIFMSPLNVHQNVYPTDGEVVYTKYHKGKYLVAWHPKSSVENERATVVVKRKDGTQILFRQIAGAVARRICTYSKIGDQTVKGSEFGFIKFGSRVDVFLPVNAKILCSVGDKCKNKITELAELM